MATEISAVCTLCSTRVTAEFAPGTGTRDYALFDIPTEVQEQCFVADDHSIAMPTEANSSLLPTRQSVASAISTLTTSFAAS